MRFLHFILTYVIYLTELCCGFKILGVFPMAIPSHYILGNALLRGLAEAGHDVTMVSPFTEKNPPKNGTWRDIVLTGFKELHEERMNKMAVSLSTTSNPLFSMILMPKLSVSFTESLLNHTNMQALIKSGEKFDAVIIGQFLDDAIKATANLFDAHLILFSSLGSNTMINQFVGNPSLPSYAPEIFASFPPKMSFSQRVLNTIYNFVFLLSLNLLSYPQHSELVRKYFPPSIEFNDVLYNASLVLMNSHPSLSNALPYVPCMIDIGGFHIKEPKNLPDDLQSYLDNAEEGVIYMSMGSNFKSKDILPETRNAILKVFAKIKQKVLWKWEEDTLPGKPTNVKLGKWLPQQEILAHPNVKLFITHGGLLSTTETIYHGVPIVAIPVFGDQHLNAKAAEIAGYGIVIPLKEVSEERLSSVLEEVFSNPKYRDEAQRRSNILKDRQIKPLDNAVYWTEYVIRHNGAKHLRVAYLDLPWYKYFLLDVFGFLIVMMVLAYIILRLTLRMVLRKIKQTKPKQQ